MADETKKSATAETAPGKAPAKTATEKAPAKTVTKKAATKTVTTTAAKKVSAKVTKKAPPFVWKGEASRVNPFAGLGGEHLPHHVDEPGFVLRSFWPCRILLMRGEETGLLRTMGHLGVRGALAVGAAGEVDGGVVLRVGSDLAYGILDEKSAAAADKLSETADIALDLSEERVVMGMGGVNFEDVWMQFCPLDLNDFGVGSVAGTVMGGVSVVLWRVEGEELGWRVMLRRSYLGWFYGLISAASRPYGCHLS